MLNAEKARADRYQETMDSIRVNFYKEVINVRAYAEGLENQLKIGAINRRPKYLNQSIEEITIKNIQFFD